MTCRELVELLSDYLSDDLPRPERSAFEDHVRECEPCARYVEGFAATVGLARDAFRDLDAGVRGEAPEELVGAILAARRRA
jgi:anti-sigma factor RsiW